MNTPVTTWTDLDKVNVTHYRRKAGTDTRVKAEKFYQLVCEHRNWVIDQWLDGTTPEGDTAELHHISNMMDAAYSYLMDCREASQRRLEPFQSLAYYLDANGIWVDMEEVDQ